MSRRNDAGVEPRFRRSPHLVGYWTAGGPVLENYATGRRGPGAPIVQTLLGIFDRWRPLDDLIETLPNHPRRSLARLVNALVRLTFLQRSDRPPLPAEAALTAWDGWSPAASFFHCATRDVKYSTDLDATARRMRAQARRVPMPPPVKRYRSAPVVELPSPTADSEFPRVLESRRTWRQFSTRPASLTQLAGVLRLTFGVQRWVELPGIGTVALKSSPSGGARHPIECYVLALRVGGLTRGLYHYRADTHVLERLARGATARQVARYLPGQAWYGNASVLVIMTAVFARTRWRYPFARAYRVVLAEAGHLCQTFCLTSSWLGLAPFCTMALADTAIERDLGVDGIEEAAIYAAGFGTRPAGVDWAPWPAGSTGSRRARSTGSRPAVGQAHGRSEPGRGASRTRRSRASTNGGSSASARSHSRRKSS
jgi:SagB-type dehydrogenase family enzyme